MELDSSWELLQLIPEPETSWEPRQRTPAMGGDAAGARPPSSLPLRCGDRANPDCEVRHDVAESDDTCHGTLWVLGPNRREEQQLLVEPEEGVLLEPPLGGERLRGDEALRHAQPQLQGEP
eukprot:9486850-Alexandrium_andersonii.AAC.1